MLKRILCDQSGAILAEYAMLLSIGAVACGVAIYYFGEAISGAFGYVANAIGLGWG
jgi:Flp pilus assembly pilin Flp